MKILIKGYYGFGNLGDDILMVVTYGLLKQKYQNAEYYIFSNYTLNLKGFDQVENYNHYIYKLLEKNVVLIDWTYNGHFDLIVNGGGGIYFDFNAGPWPYYFLNRFVKMFGAKRTRQLEIFLRRVFIKPPRITFEKQLGIGIGLGDFHPSSKIFFAKMAEIGSCESLVVRDDYSIKMLQVYKFSRKAVRLSDLAFLTAYWQNSIPVRRKERIKRIGITLIDWRGDDLMFENAALLAKELKKMGFELRFFSFDENHDKRYIKKFENNNLLVWRPNEMTLKFFLEQIADCDIMISARAHGAILAACLGVVPLCINISIKLREVGKMLTEGNPLLVVEKDLYGLLGQVEAIDRKFSEISSEVHKRVRNNQELMKKLEPLL